MVPAAVQWSANPASCTCVVFAPELLQLYDGADAELKLNDVVEFYGVLATAPELHLPQSAPAATADAPAVPSDHSREAGGDATAMAVDGGVGATGNAGIKDVMEEEGKSGGVCVGNTEKSVISEQEEWMPVSQSLTSSKVRKALNSMRFCIQ